MGCFSTCFQKSDRRKPLRPRKPTPRLNQLLQRDQPDFDALEPLQLTDIKEQDSEDVQREKVNISGRKKVTFDPNVKIYEGLPAEDEPEGDFLERGKSEKETKTPKEEEKQNQCHSDSSSSSSLFSYPPNGYRYQNCDSDDEFDQLVSDDESDMDPYLSDDEEHEEEEDEEEVKEGSSESLFSLSIDSRKHKLSTETGDKEVNSPMPVKSLDEDEDDKMKNLDSVLNPVENLTQWKAIKARAKLSSRNKAKENKILGQQSNIQVIEEPILKPPVNSAKSKNSNKEIAVVTSLSTWLVGSEIASPSVSKTSSASVGNSPKDFEERPILGAVTVEEINQFSAASTPRKSPSRSPDDMPIIGTVGSYWSHTGQGNSSKGNSNTRSNLRQGNKVNFNSSPTFEKRLESVS